MFQFRIKTKAMFVIALKVSKIELLINTTSIAKNNVAYCIGKINWPSKLYINNNTSIPITNENSIINN
jgi:hypothetical protein